MTSIEDLSADLDSRLSDLEALIARGGTLSKIGRAFNELLHPRGSDGKFIEKGGYVTGTFTNDSGKTFSLDGNSRAKVVGFSKNPDGSDDPLVEVELINGTRVKGKASDIQQVAATKGRLSIAEGDMTPQPSETPGRTIPPEGSYDSLAPKESSILESSFNPPDDQKRTITAEEISKIQKQPGAPVETDDIEEALQLLADGKKVKLRSEDRVTVLLDRMLEVYNDAKAKGEDAPLYNLCNVTVEGTNLFCAESKNINRVHMPQLKGIPLPGTPAADLEADSRGEVDLTDAFRTHLEEKGILIEDKQTQASHLKATQDELNGSKTAGIGRAIENGTYDEARLFVSRDNYIVDGHHRWSATLGVDLRDGQAGDLYMPVAVIDMDIIDLLGEANDFAEQMGIPRADVGEPTPFQLTDLLPNEKPDFDSLDPLAQDDYVTARRAGHSHTDAMSIAHTVEIGDDDLAVTSA